MSWVAAWAFLGRLVVAAGGCWTQMEATLLEPFRFPSGFAPCFLEHNQSPNPLPRTPLHTEASFWFYRFPAVMRRFFPSILVIQARRKFLASRLAPANTSPGLRPSGVLRSLASICCFINFDRQYLKGPPTSFAAQQFITQSVACSACGSGGALRSPWPPF